MSWSLKVHVKYEYFLLVVRQSVSIMLQVKVTELGKAAPKLPVVNAEIFFGQAKSVQHRGRPTRKRSLCLLIMLYGQANLTGTKRSTVKTC